MRKVKGKLSMEQAPQKREKRTVKSFQMHQQNNSETKLETPNCDTPVIVVKKYIPGLIFDESAKEALRTSLHKTIRKEEKISNQSGEGKKLSCSPKILFQMMYQVNSTKKHNRNNKFKLSIQYKRSQNRSM